MIAVAADRVTVEDADTLKCRVETPLIVDTQASEAFRKGDRDVSLDTARYDEREQVWVRCPNLDTHESYTTAGKEETDAFEGWLGSAEANHDADEFELVLYAPGREAFPLGSYDRVLASIARRYDGDDWATSALTKFGNAVAWREQTPR